MMDLIFHLHIPVVPRSQAEIRQYLTTSVKRHELVLLHQVIPVHIYELEYLLDKILFLLMGDCFCAWVAHAIRL